MATVGLVGLGLLGAAVASRLGGQGHEVVGYDVLPEKIQGLVTLGGRGAPSAAAVARDAEAVCTLLPSLASVEEAVLGDSGIGAGAPAGLTVIQMSTISPVLTRRLAQEVGGRGLSFLDCPVSGTSGMVARGEGMICRGGGRPPKAGPRGPRRRRRRLAHARRARSHDHSTRVSPADEARSIHEGPGPHHRGGGAGGCSPPPDTPGAATLRD